MDLKDAARDWLILTNHHGCHLTVCGAEDDEMPRSRDVDELTSLLESVRKLGWNEALVAVTGIPQCSSETALRIEVSKLRRE